MFQRLVNHNPDIQQLVAKGYAVSFDSNYLVVRDIPYLNQDKSLRVGAIVSKLIFMDKDHVQLEDHQIFFCGSHPHQLDGTAIPNLGGGESTLALTSEDLVVQRSFSNKPTNGFKNLFDKIESYVALFSGPAMDLFDVNPLTFNTTEVDDDTVFIFNDTLTSRAEIGDLTAAYKEDVIAIIGLGGTGSYVLDFLVKTPVKEIRGFDLDWYHVHNAYRSPGKLDAEELDKRKADVYQKRYEGFRSGVNISAKHILSDSDDDLTDVTFAFVCVDKGSSRTEIFDVLMRLKIPFIDVGMGLNRDNGSIGGMLRTTFYGSETAPTVVAQKLSPMHDDPNDMYVNNIQISELNALNACLAVLKFKQLRGFYTDTDENYHTLFSIHDLHLVGENGKN